eukprot:1086941-Pyramimonas_sp.AAC.1
MPTSARRILSRTPPRRIRACTLSVPASVCNWHASGASVQCRRSEPSRSRAQSASPLRRALR